MAKNLGLYTVTGSYTPQVGPLNYETVLGDSNVIDSPNNLNQTSPNNFYPINEFGPYGGYSNTMALINVYSNGPNQGPYLDSFVPSFYTPYSILLSNNPDGSNGSLSQDSVMIQFGAKSLKKSFEDRINFEIYQQTFGKVSLSSLQDPFEAALVATGQQPLIYRNWKITIPENPVIAAADFVTRISGAYWPVSFIPGDYFQENVNNGLPTSQTSVALNTTNQLTGGLLGPVLNLKRNPSQIFLANTGNGQKSAMFANLYYNKYRPNYDGSYGGFLGAAEGLVNSISNIINPNGTVTSSYYIGSPNSEPEQITSPPNQVPVNSLGTQVSAPVYGPDEIGKLYEGNIERLNFGLGGKTNEDRASVDGQFVWTSPKYKKNAGFHARVGGSAGTRDGEYNTISSRYQSNESTNLQLKPDSILDNTQKLINSADDVSGPTRLKHVGNAINQVSKVFHDGYKEITKGSKIVSYSDNTTGTQAGIEYCRIFAKDTPYYTYADLQKTDGITTSGRQFEYSVLDNTYNLNIAPLKNPGSTNIVAGDSDWNQTGGKVKKYMFSIENLAWRTSGRDGFKYDDLPICERGPNGGRIMWFPPYEIKFSDSSQANWNSSSFIGRPEPIYTYKDTSRSGTLSWKIVVDHPSVLNVIVNKQLKDASSDRVNSIVNSFFAGCAKFDLYTLAAKFNTIPVSELQQIQSALNNPRLTPEELAGLKKAIPAENNVPDGKSDTTGGSTTSAQNNQPACDAFKQKYNSGFGFYFENDIPKSSNVNFKTFYDPYVADSNITKYQTNADSANFKDEVNKNTTQFFEVVKSNFKTMNEPFIEDAFKLLSENVASAITITMIGSASAVATPKYNKALSERRISSVKKFYEESKLKDFMKDGRFKVVLEKGEGEETSIPVSEEGETGGEVNCREDIVNKSGKSTPQTQIYAVAAMACRRVRVSDITITPVVVVPPVATGSTTPSVNTTTVDIQSIKPQPTTDVSQSLKKGLSKKVLRALLSECDYFEMVKETNPMIYSSFKEKIKYFSPAFHSMTPEGLNSRLTFLNQCVRPGETIPIIGPDGKPRYNDSLNTSFGTPPVLVLRIGDFYHTKIIPNNVSFSYEPLVFDMNPEGIGVQPMIVDVQLSFNIIGGMGLKEPVDQLQNALSFNFYANTEIYDERSTYTDTSFEALDKKIFDAALAKSDIKNETVKNQQTNSSGDPIGVIKTEVNIPSGQTGEIVYQTVMDKLIDVSKSYYENVINQLETIQTQYNFGIVQLVSDLEGRDYVNGTIGSKTVQKALYGKPKITKTDELFTRVINDVDNGTNPIIYYLVSEKEKYTLSENKILILRENIKQYINDLKSNFNSGLTTIVQELSTQQSDLLMYIRELNLVVNDKTDGYLKDGQTPVAYNLSGSTKAGDTVTPPYSNTYDELKGDYEKLASGLTEYITLLETGYNGKSETKILSIGKFNLDDNNPLRPIPTDEINKFRQDVYFNLPFYLVMARELSDENKKQNFISRILTPNISNDKKLVKYVNNVCDDLQSEYEKQLERELKRFEKLKKTDGYKQYTNGITSIMYDKGKPRKLIYDTLKGPNVATQEEKIKQIYGSVNYGTDIKSFDGIIKM